MTTQNQQPKIRKWARILLVVSGSISVGLGILGIFLPVLPTTPFLLLAAVCYAHSSPRLHSWLLNNKWFGSYIKNYIGKKGIPQRVKFFILVLLWGTIGLSIYLTRTHPVITVILALVATGVTIHILTIKTMKE